MARDAPERRAGAGPVGWASVAGAGAIAGIGFTVSLLIATLAFTGADLEEAKIGVLSAALATSLLPQGSRARALMGTATRRASPRTSTAPT